MRRLLPVLLLLLPLAACGDASTVEQQSMPTCYVDQGAGQSASCPASSDAQPGVSSLPEPDGGGCPTPAVPGQDCFDVRTGPAAKATLPPLFDEGQLLSELSGSLALVRGLDPDQALDVVAPRAGRSATACRTDLDRRCLLAVPTGDRTLLLDAYGSFSVQDHLARLGADGREVVLVRGLGGDVGRFTLLRDGRVVRQFDLDGGGRTGAGVGTPLPQEAAVLAALSDPLPALLQLAAQVTGTSLAYGTPSRLVAEPGSAVAVTPR